MELIVLFDPSIKSFNKGDEIIYLSSKKALKDILKNRNVIRCSTHAPVVTFYQNIRISPEIKLYDNAKFKFVCGSNLLWKNMFVPRPSWNINPFNIKPYEGCILMGVGTGLSYKKTNMYTKALYRKILSKKYIHSVRDDATVKFLNSIGIKAINTGCPTMWQFTEEFCKVIPHNKSNKVIFTLTDYGKNPIYDQKLINILNEKYDEVFFWVQGTGDYDYLNSFENVKDIRIVSPSVDDYEEVLNSNDIDYVGTRLHAGIFAMQHKKRTIILSIDNRVKDMSNTYDLNTIDREEIENLGNLIDSNFTTNVKLKEENIQKWLSQFEVYR